MGSSMNNKLVVVLTKFHYSRYRTSVMNNIEYTKNIFVANINLYCAIAKIVCNKPKPPDYCLTL